MTEVQKPNEQLDVKPAEQEIPEQVAYEQIANGQMDGNDDFDSLLKYREENREKILEQYGLNEYLVQSLQNQGITVEIAGAENDGYPHIDTWNVYHGVLDQDGNIISGQMSSLPIIGYKIDSISRSSDGITVFNLTNTRTGEKTSHTFSKQKFEEIPYADQLELGKPERANAKRRDKVAEQIANPTHGRDQYGMNQYLAERLQNQGITVEYGNAGNGDYPILETSNVHLAFLDDKGDIRSGVVSSIAMAEHYLYSANRTSDGFTTLEIVNKNSGKLERFIFSKDKWEDTPDETKRFYKKQLEE